MSILAIVMAAALVAFICYGYRRHRIHGEIRDERYKRSVERARRDEARKLGKRYNWPHYRS